MASERELKVWQEEKLFDILRLMKSGNEEEMRGLLRQMFERAQSGMTIDEVEAVRQRVARSLEVK